MNTTPTNPTPTTPELLEEIRKRCEAATADEWTYSDEFLFAGTPGIAEWTREASEADKQFLVHARTDIPALLEMVEGLQKKNAELEKNMAWGRSEFVKYRTALNRIAHPDTYPSGGTPDKEIARRALLLGMEITPLPKDAYDSLRERVRGLEGALKPFVKFYERLSDGRLKVPKSGIWYGLDCGTEKEAAITIEDFQQATKSLSEGEG